MGALSSFYERRVFPWLNDQLTTTPEIVRLRVEALSAARGRVVEIGFGTGQNLIHYPTAVESLVAIEPNDGMIDRAAPNIARSRVPVEVLLGQAEMLPILDRSIDTAVSTLTLCSVRSPALALSE